MTELIDDILINKEDDNSKEKRMNFSLQLLENQFIKMETDNNKNINSTEEHKTKEKPQLEKFSSIPNMLKCFICEDFCEDAVQIFCCYENFCDKHIKEEIMKNFTCPNCKAATTLKEIIPNKKLREIISWFKEIISDTSINIQNQNQNNYINNHHNLNNFNANILNSANYQNNFLKNFTKSTTPNKEIDKDYISSVNNLHPENLENTKTFFYKENLIDEKNKILNIVNNNNYINKPEDNKIDNVNSSLNHPVINTVNVKIEDKKYSSNENYSIGENLKSNNLNFNTEKENNLHEKKLENNINNIDNTNTKNDINKIEFKKENNMTPEEKMQLYNKINNESSHSGSNRKQSEEINENTSQKGNIRMYDPRFYMAMMSGMGGMGGMSAMPGMHPGMSMGGIPGMTGMAGIPGMTGIPGMPGMHQFNQVQDPNVLGNESNNSDENSSDSSSDRKRKKHRKRSRSRDNKHSKNKDKEKDKEKTHHKHKDDKDRQKDKEGHKHREKDKEKEKDKDKNREKDKDKNRDKDNEKKRKR